MNAVLVEIVTRAVGVDVQPTIHHDLDPLIGSWVPDPDTERALVEQRRITPGDWE